MHPSSCLQVLIIMTLCYCSVSSLIESDRSERFISWGWGTGVVRFENAACTAVNSLTGTCYTRRQCDTVGGFRAGRCAQNIAVCCVIQYGCGNTSAYNNTYFTNTNFPNSFSGGGRCTMSIRRCSADICQVRIDFMSLTLAQPDADGVCVNDALTITGSASRVPIICGENAGQHIYLQFAGDELITLNIVTNPSLVLGRSWNIRATQLACNCPSLAPTGCLQFYRGVTGTVQSLNYGTTASNEITSLGTVGTRQLANTNYGICVEMAPGYCSIEWSPVSANSFAVSNDSVAESLLTQSPTINGTECRYDFIIIPNAYVNNAAENADRFCGNTLPTVTSSLKPFVLYTVTNGNEVDGIANRGFALRFAQQRCNDVIF